MKQSYIFVSSLLLVACSYQTTAPEEKTELGAGAPLVTSQYSVQECSQPLPSPEQGSICTINGGHLNKTDYVIRGDVLTPNSIIKGGSVTVQNGVITDVSCKSPSAGELPVISCPGAAISPGLINSHDHISYNQNYPGKWGEERYDRRHQWRKGLDGHKKIPAFPAKDKLQIAWSEVRQVIAGTTSITGSGGYEGFLRNLDRQDKLGELKGKETDYQVFPLGDASKVQGHDKDCDYPKYSQTKQPTDHVFLPHVGEGIDAYANNEIKCLTGRGYPESEGVNLAGPRSTFIHGVAGNPADSKVFKKADMTIVWSPRSNISLYGNTAPVTMYDAAGVRLALSTDWTPSGSMNLFREMACASSFSDTYLDHHFSDYDLWKMVTINAAHGVGFADQIGSIETGKVADLTIVKNDSKQGYSAVVHGELTGVALVVRAGNPLYGDTNVIEAFQTNSCEPLTLNGGSVCGSNKSICVKQEIGITFEELSQANTADKSYPLFFCGLPKDEPTCTPFRKNEYTGIISADDLDGDGVLNPHDNCVKMFNPIRPMDKSGQADHDGNGKGDLCDF